VHRAGCSRPASGRPRFELGDLVREHGDALRTQHAVTPEQAEVLRALANCRTAALGGHLDRCCDCGYERPAYNSCRNRHCPKCQALDAARWLAARMQTLLPIPYFHVVFTLPGELAPLVRRNRRRLFDLLFAAASQTLLELGRDPRRLGAQLGATAVLHTWTRDLRFHPHIHAVVTGGGLSADGQRWVAADPDYLFPVHVLSALWRGKMLAAIGQEHQRQALELPDELQPGDALATLMHRLYATEWVTYIKPPFAGPEQVLAYLGRYTHRVALSNHRLLDVTADRVTLRTRGEGTVTLTPVELLRRFLLHVLPKGFVRIRHYGLLAASNLGNRLPAARRLLSEPVEHDPGTGHSGAATTATEARATATPDAPTEPQRPSDGPADWRTLLATLTGIDTTRCPACGSSAWVRCPLAATPTRAPPKRIAA
jgi:hypothetical protein